MHKTMVSIVGLEKIEIIRSEEFMPSEARQKFLKKMIILGLKTAILGPKFCRILVLGPHFWWSGGPWIRPCIRSKYKTTLVYCYCKFYKYITHFTSHIILALSSFDRVPPSIKLSSLICVMPI